MAEVVRLGSELVNFFAVEEDGRWTVLDAGAPGSGRSSSRTESGRTRSRPSC